MLRRTLLFAPVVAAAAGLPVVSTQTGWFKSANSVNSPESASTTPANQAVPFVGAAQPAVAPSPLATSTPSGNRGAFAGAPGAARPNPAAIPSMSFEQVFRLDVGPDWVMHNWPRVSSTLADPLMPGMRAPLVTGDKIDDLVGSLSMYFDQQQKVQRMQFHGYTGNPTRLAKFMQARYQMRAYPGMGHSLYMAQWNGDPKSVLQIGFAPATIANHHPYRRYEVRLELNRPSDYYQLSPEFQALVDYERTRTQLGASP